MKTIAHFLAAVMLTWAGAAQAVMLHYSGNHFTSVNTSGPTTPADSYTTNDSVQGWIELASMLAPNLSSQTVTPLSFSFSDGVNTLTDSNATSSSFRFWTNDSGMPTQWEFFVEASFLPGGNGTQRTISSFNTIPAIGPSRSNDSGQDVLCGPQSLTDQCTFGGDPFYSQFAEVGGNPGTWEYRTNDVPAPATFALFGLGLLGVGYRRRRH